MFSLYVFVFVVCVCVIDCMVMSVLCVILNGPCNLFYICIEIALCCKQEIVCKKHWQHNRGEPSFLVLLHGPPHGVIVLLCLLDLGSCTCARHGMDGRAIGAGMLLLEIHNLPVRVPWHQNQAKQSKWHCGNLCACKWGIHNRQACSQLQMGLCGQLEIGKCVLTHTRTNFFHNQVPGIRWNSACRAAHRSAEAKLGKEMFAGSRFSMCFSAQSTVSNVQLAMRMWLQAIGFMVCKAFNFSHSGATLKVSTLLDKIFCSFAPSAPKQTFSFLPMIPDFP